MSAPTKRQRHPSEARSARIRAAARHRALARLAHEHPERYRQLYAEERGESPPASAASATGTGTTAAMRLPRLVT